ARFVGIVVSRAMLQAEWPTLERSIAVWSDVSGAKGRVIPLLRENVTLPASLRVRNWIDFRDDAKFDESFRELITCLRGEKIARGKGGLSPTVPSAGSTLQTAPILITASTGADRVTERLVSNLYRVTSLPQKIYYAPTKIRDKKEIHEYIEQSPPFILRDGKLYTFTDLNAANIFDPVLKGSTALVCSDTFSDWFSDDEYRRRAIEVLNVYLKQHAWKRWLRFDGAKGRYFFSPKDGKPKQISWQIGGRLRTREVTTQHTRREKQDNGDFKDVPFGWRHQAFRANFILVMESIMLKLEPTYMLTKDDGKTPRTSRWVGPILSHWTNQERNGQILRSLRFWSLVLAGGKELRIETGQEPVCVDLTPISGTLDFGIASDQMDFDALMDAEVADDARVPQLEMQFGEESSITDVEEDQVAEEDRETE
ncbi:MAG TPA: toll/interleukin-1 receptor domain-containing protein, partial [Terriglobales bacterium]|nr:toll/interleukin-1 receptor domain-containing protein [Terriglobales bacterium]